jgi:hypothetical protein
MTGWQFDLIHDYILIVGKAGLESWDNISIEKNPMHKPVWKLKDGAVTILPPTCH